MGSSALSIVPKCGDQDGEVFLQASVEERRASPAAWDEWGAGAHVSLPSCPLRESSQPQLSKSPRLQFRVSVYMTPAELMAWTKAVSRFAVKGGYKDSRYAKDFMARAVLEIVPTMQESAQDICSGEDFVG